MAYAEVAGLSPVNGLYALLLPAVLYTVLGSSRQLIVGPEGSISTLTGASVLGLAAAGPSGLVRALEILEDEIRTCLGLLGVTSYAELTPRHLAKAAVVRDADTFSAFPLPPGDTPPIAE